jgi:ADP-ribose pyrophosphatase YjhB (NUDIX family)
MMDTRKSSRGVIIDNDNKVLLFRFIQNSIVGDRVFWVFPGGGLHKDESFEEALLRELKEETSIDSVYHTQWIWTRNIELNGKRGVFLSYERYYLVKAHNTYVNLNNFTDNEKKTFLKYKWWSCDEIQTSEEEFALPDTYCLLTDLIKGHIPERPIKVR